MASKIDFKKEVSQIANEIQVEPYRVQVKHIKFKLGNCTPGKTVTFDFSVLDLDNLERKKVIMHEVRRHLRCRNLSKIFKLLLREHVSRVVVNERTV